MNIAVYTKDDCQPCRATKHAMYRAGLIYTEYRAAEHMDELAPLGHTSAPVVVVTDDTGAMVDHWSGFRPDRVKGLIRE